MGMTYKDSGVNLELYEQAMARLPGIMKRTHTSRVMDLPGGFAGLFRLDRKKRFPRNYKEPVLVSGTDGVGTKLKVAILAKSYRTVGIDLVAMCVNDCLCLGAEPLFFLDYLALNKDDPALIAELVEGVADGCELAGAALLGGETAIMPDLYAEGDFDMAGFCVAVAERQELIDGKGIKPGDRVIGLASSGLHSNGFSLVRKIVFDRAGLAITDRIKEQGNKTVAEILLEPTRIYVKPVIELLLSSSRKNVRGLAHITGGGIADNLERILPQESRALLSKSAWKVPPIFRWLQKLGGVDEKEMFQVFNMGIGMVVVVRPRSKSKVLRHFESHGLGTYELGEIVAGESGVDWE